MLRLQNASGTTAVLGRKNKQLFSLAVVGTTACTQRADDWNQVNTAATGRQHCASTASK
jgi:hypothetical protein